MLAADEGPPLAAQLRALCETYPHTPKIVLVPKTQIGRALEDAVVRADRGWAGVTTHIVRHFAERIAEPRILESGRTELPVGGRSVLAAELLESLDAEDGIEDLPGRQRLAGTVAQTIETLRRGGVSPGEMQARIDGTETSATLRVVAACYDKYLSALDQNDLYDDAQVFRWATERVQEGRPLSVSQFVVAVCDAVELPERAYEFVRAVQGACKDLVRLGRGELDDPPPQRAAARFAEVATVPIDANHDHPPEHPRTTRAVGATNEVDAVFRDLLEGDVPLDDVEIAVAGERPYVSLIADRAEWLGVPVSVGTGVPVARTRTGKAVLSFLEWIAEDFDAERLIRMLRSGHLRIDRVSAHIGDDVGPVELDAHEVATLLAARRYESGRDGYKGALNAALGRVDDRIDTLEDRGLDPGREQARRRRLQFVRSFIGRLLELAPREATLQTMATACRQFLEQFGPVDPPPDDKPEADRTLEEAARTVLWQRIDRLTRLPVTYEASGAQLAALLQRWLDGQYVRAEHPRPGTAHVVPLESAGYGDRSSLYVVGMDADTLSTAAVEETLLRDADRQALSDSLEGVLPERQSASDEAQWLHERALRRHQGSLSLYARTFDVESGEERYPSPLFLRLETGAASLEYSDDQESSGRVEGFLPAPERIQLSDVEAWLAAYRERGPQSSEGGTARSVLTEKYPWIQRGEHARQARQSNVYTAHDGLLPDGDYPELDILGTASQNASMSASRLETLAETPYLYFLRYVLGVEPLDEPALDDEPWLNARRRGSILHATYKSFMESLDERDERPTPEHDSLLEEILRAELDDEIKTVAPPSNVVEEAAYRQLLEDARVFLRAEVEHCRDHDPLYFEIGFGYGPYRRVEGDFGAVTLPIGNEEMALRGRIDRVDRRPDGTLAVWDYKTGSLSSFDEEAPLKEGGQLQWALYAYALEERTQSRVGTSGYYFPTTDELGARLVFDPESYREVTEEVLTQLSRLAATGTFPMHPRARSRSGWQYRGYDRIFRDLGARSRRLRAKSYPEDRPHPPSFG